MDSNLCAASSLLADTFKGKGLRQTKYAMVLLLAAGIAVANIPGLTVTGLFLMYGTLRSSTLLPTVLTLMGASLRPKGIVAGILSALLVGFPISAYGNIQGDVGYKALGSLLTVALSGAVALAVSRAGCRRDG